MGMFDSALGLGASLGGAVLGGVSMAIGARARSKAQEQNDAIMLANSQRQYQMMQQQALDSQKAADEAEAKRQAQLQASQSAFDQQAMLYTMAAANLAGPRPNPSMLHGLPTVATSPMGEKSTPLVGRMRLLGN